MTTIKSPDILSVCQQHYPMLPYGSTVFRPLASAVFAVRCRRYQIKHVARLVSRQVVLSPQNDLRKHRSRNSGYAPPNDGSMPTARPRAYARRVASSLRTNPLWRAHGAVSSARQTLGLGAAKIRRILGCKPAKVTGYYGSAGSRRAAAYGVARSRYGQHAFAKGVTSRPQPVNTAPMCAPGQPYTSETDTSDSARRSLTTIPAVRDAVCAPVVTQQV